MENLLKELKRAYGFDHLTELGRMIGIEAKTIQAWNTRGIAPDKRRMLELLLEQKQKLIGYELFFEKALDELKKIEE